MSPEVMSGYIIEDGAINREAMQNRKAIKVSKKTDIWSLGIILYQLVYGLLPYSSVPGGKLAKIKATSDLKIAVDYDQHITLDPWLLDTLRKCLEKKPCRRASIADLINHPYLKANTETCSVCKDREKQFAKMTKRRLDSYYKCSSRAMY